MKKEKALLHKGYMPVDGAFGGTTDFLFYEGKFLEDFWQINIL